MHSASTARGSEDRSLRGLIAGEQISCTEVNRDRYDRIVAMRAIIDGQYIGTAIVWNGWALELSATRPSWRRRRRAVPVAWRSGSATRAHLRAPHHQLR
jgi:endonuclease YncB( thermonuclease family)